MHPDLPLESRYQSGRVQASGCSASEYSCVQNSGLCNHPRCTPIIWYDQESFVVPPQSQPQTSRIHGPILVQTEPSRLDSMFHLFSYPTCQVRFSRCWHRCIIFLRSSSPLLLHSSFPRPPSSASSSRLWAPMDPEKPIRSSGCSGECLDLNTWQRMSEDTSDRMSQRMPDRISEYMSEYVRMPV